MTKRKEIYFHKLSLLGKWTWEHFRHGNVRFGRSHRSQRCPGVGGRRKRDNGGHLTADPITLMGVRPNAEQNLAKIVQLQQHRRRRRRRRLFSSHSSKDEFVRFNWRERKSLAKHDQAAHPFLPPPTNKKYRSTKKNGNVENKSFLLPRESSQANYLGETKKLNLKTKSEQTGIDWIEAPSDPVTRFDGTTYPWRVVLASSSFFLAKLNTTANIRWQCCHLQDDGGSFSNKFLHNTRQLCDVGNKKSPLAKPNLT